MPPGVLLLLCCLHLFNGLAWLYGVCARIMLGPSTVDLRERVEGLRDASARILTAADDERRRIERDLHDGAQQRLVALNVLLGVVETKIESDPATAAPLVARARQEAQAAVKELRELARGIHPALLADRGLTAALEALAGRAPFPVAVAGVPARRLPAAVEATAYFITAEALTNVAKYAGATRAWVELSEERGRLRVTVTDDGVGGADPAGAQACAACATASPRSTGASRSTRLPAAAPCWWRELPLEHHVRRLAGAALAAAAILAFSGCDNGPPVTQTRPITTFTRLDVSGDLELEVRLFNRPDPGVRITAGEKAIDRIKTELDENTLRISTKSRGLTIGPDPLGPVSISLGVPALVGPHRRGEGRRQAQRPVREDVRAAGRRLRRHRGARARRRLHARGRRIGRQPVRRPRDAERERADRRLRRHRAARPSHAGARHGGQRQRHLPRPPGRQRRAWRARAT